MAPNGENQTASEGLQTGAITGNDDAILETKANNAAEVFTLGCAL